MRSPQAAEASAREPGPTGSIRKASSWRGAKQRLIGRERTRPGASSMKNWPGTPESSPPRSRRTSRYGPTSSAARTLSASRRNAFLEGEGVLMTRAPDGLDRGEGAPAGRHARDAGGERRLADEGTVGAGAASRRCVDDEVAAPAADEVDDRRPRARLGHLAHALDRQPGRGERTRRPRRRAESESELGELPAELDRRRLVGVADGEESRSARRQRPARSALRLRERRREVVRARHHLAGRAHLGPEDGVGPGKARERKDRGLDADLGCRTLRRQLELEEARPRGEPACGLHEVHAGCLARERHRARGPWGRLEHEERALEERELDVDEADDAESRGEPPNGRADLLERRLRALDRPEPTPQIPP